jgi:hypothetical protein
MAASIRPLAVPPKLRFVSARRHRRQHGRRGKRAVHRGHVAASFVANKARPDISRDICRWRQSAGIDINCLAGGSASDVVSGGRYRHRQSKSPAPNGDGSAALKGEQHMPQRRRRLRRRFIDRFRNFTVSRKLFARWSTSAPRLPLFPGARDQVDMRQS